MARDEMVIGRREIRGEMTRVEIENRRNGKGKIGNRENGEKLEQNGKKMAAVLMKVLALISSAHMCLFLSVAS